jgi:hypothetical protein
VPSKAFIRSFGRVIDGWFVHREGKPREFGILHRDGTFTAFGAAAGSYGALSPDRRRAAFSERASDGRIWVTVVDVRTGEHIALGHLDRSPPASCR